MEASNQNRSKGRDQDVNYLDNAEESKGHDEQTAFPSADLIQDQMLPPHFFFKTPAQWSTKWYMNLEQSLPEQVYVNKTSQQSDSENTIMSYSEKNSR